ncbi:MAG: riboflavin biosynthesis protein RibD [Rhodospirillaceae bacterium]|nr:riboflavin biosynthesis protein RibD [Rhodospirillaceae bacterium]
MRLAMRLARRGLGTAYPNPAVGCILVKDECIVGRGWTQAGGRPHAETMALRQAGEKARGSTAYITLEPCAHFGETPPCSRALIDAGISRVVAAVKDPDPRTNGNGFAQLKNAGIQVTEGVCTELAASVIDGFLSVINSGLPVVTLKIASSLDFRISTKTGESKWITGESARQSGHMLRAKNDAIMTGIGTIIADDPDLTCRLAGLEERSPVRVALDTRLRMPVNSNFVKLASKVTTYIFTTEKSKEKKRIELTDLGVKIIALDSNEEGRVPLMECFRILSKSGITSVLVEAGSGLASSLLRFRLVDKLIVYRAPILIGNDGIAACNSIGVEKLNEAIGFELSSLEYIEGDTMETYVRDKGV